MIKSVIKEVLIILLLIIAIVLILGIVFYEYTPTTKKVPSKVSEYTLPEEMVKELEETIESAETQNIIQTYRVTSEDLYNAKIYNEYDSGKINPFESISKPATTPSENNVGGSSDGGNNANNTTTGNNQAEENSNPLNNNQGQFFNEVK